MKIFRLIGILAAGLSLTALAWKGFSFTFGPFLLAVLESFERQSQELLGLMEPYINDLLSNLRALLGWDISLFPHWKHVFVLMWLYFGAYARQASADGLWGTALFEGAFGGFVALLAGVAAGTAPLSDSTSSILVAVFPVVGFFAFGIGDSAWAATFLREKFTWSQKFRFGLEDDLQVLVAIGLVLVAFWISADVSFLAGLESPGLAALCVIILVLAGHYFMLGIRANRGEGETDVQKSLNDPAVALSLDMLSILGFASTLVLLGMRGV